MICITGAAGYIGSHAAESLAERGASLKALIRPKTAAGERAFLEALGAEVVLGEADDKEAVERSLEGCRAVLHCVGGIQPARPGDFRSLHEGPAEALAAAAERRGIERIVLVSAVGTGPKAESAYHRTKARAEEILGSCGAETIIVRPSLVYGRAGGLRDSKLMVRLSGYLTDGRPLPLTGGGRALIQPLFVGDLALALAASAADGIGAGRTVELGGPERMTLRAWVEMLASALGVRPRIVSLPRAVALAAAFAMERTSATPLITVDQVRVMSDNFIAPIDGLEATYGIAPTTPEAGLKRTYGP